MRILVTGAAGFIGSHLTLRLLEEGHTVLAVDNLHTGDWKNVTSSQRYRNSDDDAQRYRRLEIDIATDRFLDAFWWRNTDLSVYHSPIDRIYNLACPASPKHYQADPIKTWKTSTFGMYNVLELATKMVYNDCGNPRVLQTSTSEVYGDPLCHPQREEYTGNVNTISRRSCYDEGKRSAEALCADYARVHGLDVRIARIFNTYGPNMHPDDGRVVSNFIMQALRGDDITIYGDGTQTRSLCYVDDMVDGLIALMESDGQMSARPVNLGSTDEISVGALAEQIKRLTLSKSKIVYRDLPEDDPTVRRPDITRAIEELSWAPTVSTCDGLLRTISYFSRVIENEAK